MKFKSTIKNVFRTWILNPVERRKFQNTNVTILANTCIAGTIYHDLAQPFCSPTINMYIRPGEFVEFLKNLEYYLEQKLVEVYPESPIGYPIATFSGDKKEILLYLKHFKDFEAAAAAWERRKKRIDFNNLCIIMTDRDIIPLKNECDCCELDVLKEFDKLPYKNKVCFTKKEYPELSNCKQVTKGCDANCVGIITKIIGVTGKRMYQYVRDFNYIEFLNQII